jgi:hypothetical protein
MCFVAGGTHRAEVVLNNESVAFRHARAIHDARSRTLCRVFGTVRVNAFPSRAGAD